MTTTDGAAPIRTQGLTKHYGEVQALRGIDLDLYASEFVVLLGPSGSGKSTLLNILGGLDQATEGQVWFREKELTTLNDRGLTRFRRDHVGFVFQDPESQFVMDYVEDELAFALENAGLVRDEMRRRNREIAALCTRFEPVMYEVAAVFG